MNDLNTHRYFRYILMHTKLSTMDLPSAVEDHLQVMRYRDKKATIGTPAHQHHVLGVLADHLRLAHLVPTGAAGVGRVTVVLHGYRCRDITTRRENVYLYTNNCV